MNLLSSFRDLWPEKTFLPFIFDVLCTFLFAYLLFDAMMVIRFNGVSSRINLLSFLIPHSTKIAMWSFAALMWLRPRFGWRFPFAMFFLYCCSELLTNGIWMAVHLPEGYQFPSTNGFTSILGLSFPTTEGIFMLSTTFFVLGVILCMVFLKGRFDWKLDWAILPFAIFVGSWVLLGYQTESTIAYPSYWLETQEFIWNALYIVMVYYVFVPKVRDG